MPRMSGLELQVKLKEEESNFHDLPDFAENIVPGGGIFTVWSYRAGAGRAEALGDTWSPHARDPLSVTTV
jgi:hypothetical protein